MEEGNYPVVKATVGPGVVGDGRGSVSGWRENQEVRFCKFLAYFSINYF